MMRTDYKGNDFDPAYCAASVDKARGMRFASFGQCDRKPLRGKRHCRVHDPDNIAQKEALKTAVFDARSELRAAESRVLTEALRGVLNLDNLNVARDAYHSAERRLREAQAAAKRAKVRIPNWF